MVRFYHHPKIIVTLSSFRPSSKHRGQRKKLGSHNCKHSMKSNEKSVQLWFLMSRWHLSGWVSPYIPKQDPPTTTEIKIHFLIEIKRNRIPYHLFQLILSALRIMSTSKLRLAPITSEDDYLPEISL